MSYNGIRFLLSQPNMYYPTFDVDEMVISEPFLIEFKFKGHLIRVEIKKGFTFDGASIPQWAWSTIGSPYTGKYRLATLIHDALYKSKIKVLEGDDRKNADDIMKHLMLCMGVGKLKAGIIYRSVRIGGSGPWKNNDQLKWLNFVNVFTVEE